MQCVAKHSSWGFLLKSQILMCTMAHFTHKKQITITWFVELIFFFSEVTIKVASVLATTDFFFLLLHYLLHYIVKNVAHNKVLKK